LLLTSVNIHHPV